MKHFAQTLTAASFARNGSLAHPPMVLANPKSSFNLCRQLSHFTVLVVSLTFQTDVRAGLCRCFPE